MYALMILLSLCLVTSPSLGVEHCKCHDHSQTEIPTTSSPEEEKPEEFKLTVDEKGTKFEERIKINKKKQTERFHVPAHNDVDEADVLVDFKRNLTMYRLPQREICYLLPRDPVVPSPRKLSQILQQASGKTEKITEVEKKWKPSGEVKDRTSLSDEMAIMCAKFPIYRLKAVTSSVSTARGLWKKPETYSYDGDLGPEVSYKIKKGIFLWTFAGVFGFDCVFMCLTYMLFHGLGPDANSYGRTPIGHET